MNKILVINAGSSSMKWCLLNKGDLSEIANGLAERIFIDGHLVMNFNSQKYEKDVSLTNHEDAVKEVLKLWGEQNIIDSFDEIESIGFRVVHGGKYFTTATIITNKEMALIDKVSIYAPLHNPGAIQVIKAFQKLLPKVKLTANFDTAFHMTIPNENSIYPIDWKLTKELGIKKYGFHGISHRYITERLEQILQKDKVNFVNLHLGNGASLCAIKNSKSIDTSMGLTPLAGVMMGTRSGDIDPSIHQFVMNYKKLSIDEFTNILNRKSGLLGVSQISSDLRDIESEAEEGNHQAQLTLDIYARKIADYVANYANKVGPKIDALVFTAGVGENSLIVRKKIIERLNFKNIKLDKDLNNTLSKNIGESLLISTPESEVPVYVIRTNEEFIIARDAIRLISK